MTSSRSRASTNSRAIALAIVLLGVLAGPWMVRSADAAPRKRVVVLDFDGPKAEDFHAAVVKLLKKTQTVVATEKWNSAAEELSANTTGSKNIRKVAKKLKLDAVIEGTVEKRRDQYIIRLKVHDGTTGKLTGKDIDAKADGPKLDSAAAKDLKDELADTLDGIAGGGDDAAPADDDTATTKPKHKKPKGDDDDAAPADDDSSTSSSKPKHGGFTKHNDDEKGGDKVASDDDDTATKPKHKKPKTDDTDADAPPPPVKPKHKLSDDTTDTASTDAPPPADAGTDDDGNPKPKHKHHHKHTDDDATAAPAEDTSDPAALSPGHRALEAMIGLSLSDRKLKFNSDADLINAPPGYKGVPVAGIDLDITVFPLAFGHHNHGLLSNFGLNLLVNRVIKESSNTSYTDANNVTQKAVLDTEELRDGVGIVYRYAFNQSASSPVLGGMLRYGHQQFIISHEQNGAPLPVGAVDVPNVHYTMFEIGPYFRLPLGKLTIVANLDFIGVTNAGTISTDSQYGGGSILAYEFQAGVDYNLTDSLFLRLTGRYEQFRFKFNGTGAETTDRDTDAAQDVHGANDTYYGGQLLFGILF